MESHRRLTNPQQAPSVSLLKRAVVGLPTIEQLREHTVPTPQAGGGGATGQLTPPVPGMGKNLLQLGLGSAGLGMGAAGLFGLLNYLTAKDRVSTTQPTLIKIDKKRKKKKEEDDILEDVDEDVDEDILPFPKVAGNTFLENAYPAMAVATIGGGGIAGWKAIEWLLKKMRKSKRKGELTNARQDYESALREQYGSKEGAHDTYAALDTVYDACVKQAKIQPTTGPATDLYNMFVDNDLTKDYYKWGIITPALLRALGFGYLSYQNRQDRSRQKALREAKRRRSLELAQRRPTRFIAELGGEEENE